MDDGTEKRVPHRVYDIYQTIKVNNNYIELWEKIQNHAQSAIDNPRPGRDGKTTEFYQNIVDDDLQSLEVQMPCGHQIQLG